jgi:uncharacterized protein
MMVRWLRLVLLLVCALCLPARALAQQVVLPEALRGSSDPDVFRVLVIGDAMAGGLGAGLTRMTENDPSYEVVFRVNESSGLSRPEIYDWAQNLPSILEDKDYDAVVMMIGTNDRRDIRSGDTVLGFGSDEWKAAYAANTDAIIDAITSGGAQVYWTGLPPMADPAYDADMALVTSVHKERVDAKRETFVDFYAPLTGPDGKFVSVGPDDTGTVTKLRARDGVNFYKEGNNRLGQILLGAIKTRRADIEFEKTAQPEKLPNTPLFGQLGADGEPVVYDSAELAVAMAKQTEDGDEQPKPDSLQPAETPAKPSIARAGTQAEKFFATGDAGRAPAGRFDDFSYTPPAQ